MTAEIRKNAVSMTDALQTIGKEQEKLKQNLAGIRKIQLNPKDPSGRNLNLDISYNTTGLEDTGWKTAQATGALAFMPYAESERFSSIYDIAQTFLKIKINCPKTRPVFLAPSRDTMWAKVTPPKRQRTLWLRNLEYGKDIYLP